MDARIVDLIGYARNNVPRATITLFTNGDLLTAEKYLALKHAGVDMFCISQHSEHPSQAVLHTLDFIKENHPGLLTVEYIDIFKSDDKTNKGGLVDVKPKRRSSCFKLSSQLVFDYAGNAVLCCDDYNSSIVFGNINDKDIYEIWNDKNYRRIRNLIQCGFWPYDICRKCVGLMT